MNRRQQLDLLPAGTRERPGLSRVVFSRGRDDWATPPAVVEPLRREFGLVLDVCATAENATCPRFFSPADDGLRQPWAPLACWMNPPYSQVARWMAKAAEEARRGATVVALVPARTDTKWWHAHVYDAAQSAFRPGVCVRFVSGRIRFEGAAAGAPFPSAVIIFRPLDMAQPLSAGVGGGKKARP